MLEKYLIPNRVKNSLLVAVILFAGGCIPRLAQDTSREINVEPKASSSNYVLPQGDVSMGPYTNGTPNLTLSSNLTYILPQGDIPMGAYTNGPKRTLP